MAYIHVENFKFGLDARRSELTSVPGTLIKAENGQINTGGEFEKRKAFVFGALPVGTFGLEVTSLGLVTFGSFDFQINPDPETRPPWTVNGQKIYYHPLSDPYSDESDMTAVLFSTSFAGKAFVIASFSSGYSFVFYDFLPVGQFIEGYINPGETDPASLSETYAIKVINSLGGLGFSAVSNSPNTGQTQVTGPLSMPFNLTVADTDPTAVLTETHISDQTTGSNAVGPIAVFSIDTKPDSIDHITVPFLFPDIGTWNLIAAPVTAATETAMANAVAAAINVNAAYGSANFNGGFTAVANAKLVIITGPTTPAPIPPATTPPANDYSSFTGAAGIYFTGGDITIGYGAMTVQVIPTYMQPVFSPPLGSLDFGAFTPVATVPGTVIAIPKGGKAPYTYFWEVDPSTTAGSIVINSPTSDQTGFGSYVPLYNRAPKGIPLSTVPMYVKCTVTDSSNPTLVVSSQLVKISSP